MNLLFCSKVKQLMGEVEVATVLDIGANDGRDSIRLCNHFKNAQVYSFECNPETVITCKKNIRSYNKITLISKAVSNVDGETLFYSAINGKGASSLFKALGEYEKDVNRKNGLILQKEINVSVTRIDTWMQQQGVECVDVVWMDLQGGELLALEGMGEKIKDVKVIHTEVQFKRIYENCCVFEDVDGFLKDKGFRLVAIDEAAKDAAKGWWTDAVYVREAK